MTRVTALRRGAAGLALLLFGGASAMAGPLSIDSDLAPLDSFQECDACCPEMIVLPLSDFIMGGPIGDSINGLVAIDGKLAMVEVGHPAIGADERPLHRVEIDIPIAMGRNEVTYDQWMACVEDGGCGGHVPNNIVLMIDEERRRVEIPVLGSHPVIDVSYFDAQAYVAWLNAKIGVDAYRLPTEAEWEYAARAGTQTRFAQGDAPTSDQANFNGRGTEKMTGMPHPHLVSRRVPVPVEELDAANQWGLRHMSGNVIEQTRSCYTDSYAGWSTSSEWLRQSMVSICKRVFRGGGFHTAMDYLRVASRGSGNEERGSRYSGFRIVREMN
ncbi:MAG: formylglycine-generating enzyme family protein [Pseudomonadota bacterium]